MSYESEYTQIGHDIIGAAFEVRKVVGRGLRECYYRDALAWELRQLGYEVETEFIIKALYKGVEISDAYKADVFVDNRVIIETKALTQVGPSEVRQLITYLKLSDIRLGYLINFGATDFSMGKYFEPYPYYKGIYRFVSGM